MSTELIAYQLPFRINFTLDDLHDFKEWGLDYMLYYYDDPDKEKFDNSRRLCTWHLTTYDNTTLPFRSYITIWQDHHAHSHEYFRDERAYRCGKNCRPYMTAFAGELVILECFDERVNEWKTSHVRNVEKRNG